MVAVTLCLFAGSFVFGLAIGFLFCLLHINWFEIVAACLLCSSGMLVVFGRGVHTLLISCVL